MTSGIPNRDPMINRSLAFLVAALGALVLGLASTATMGGPVGVDVARAQSPVPSAGTAADSGVDDTSAGCLDQGGHIRDDTDTASVTAADPGSCPATGTDPSTGSTADPDAGLDDTPVGGLDNTDLGGPVDDTDQPAAADPPPTTTPDPSPGRHRQSAPKPKSSKKENTSKTKRKSSRRIKRRSKRGHSHRRAARDRAPPAPSSSSSDDGNQRDKVNVDAGLTHPDGRPTPGNHTISDALPGAAPIGVPNFLIDKFRIPPFLLPIYQAAGIEYGIRWEVLAGINEIETDYGRNLNVSSAGALGWMQFMPATWKQYGVDANHDGKKDPFNPVDAIFAAARYLRAAGADSDVRRAIFAYNHADWYVDSV